MRKASISKTLVIQSETIVFTPSMKRSFQAIPWDGNNFPNLFEFDTLIVAIPAKADLFNKYFEEIRFATSMDVNVFWLIESTSNVTCIEKIIGSKTLQLRKPGTEHFCVNEKYKSYLKLIDKVWHILPNASSWNSIAYYKRPTAPVALEASYNESVETILPFTTKYFEAQINELIKIGKVRTTLYSRSKETVLVLLLLVCLTIFIYHEVDRRHASVLSLAGQSKPQLAKELSGKYILGEFPGARSYLHLMEKGINPFRYKTADPETFFTKTNLIPLLTFAHDINLLSLENQVIDVILQNYSSEPQLLALLLKHVESIAVDAKAKLTRGEFELARFNAQRVLNISDKLTENSYARVKGSTANECRRIIELIQWQFIQGDSLMALAAKNAFKQKTLLKLPVHKFINQDIQDNYDYIRIAIDHKVGKDPNLNYDSIRHLWSEFVVEHPDSEKIDEAFFNQINCLLDQSWKASGKRLLILNQMVINRCNEFTTRFPDSYLADDALRYALHCSLTISDTNLALEYYFRLAREYPSSDAFHSILVELKVILFKGLEDFNEVAAMDFMYFLAATSNDEVVKNTIQKYSNRGHEFDSNNVEDFLHNRARHYSHLEHKSFIKTFLPLLKKNGKD